jgi:hypothetical protein
MQRGEKMKHVKSGIILKIALGIAMAISLGIPSGCTMFIAKEVYKAVKGASDKDHQDKGQESK